MNRDVLSQLRINVAIALMVWSLWLSLIDVEAAIGYVARNWEIVLTMILGSLVAGATSEGGGAVAFPVFTKILHIEPYDAKVFALAIQSVGMTAASVFIVLARVSVEWRVIFWSGIGGIPGIILGASVLAPMLPPSLTRITFTAMVSGFAVVLMVMLKSNRGYHMLLPRDGIKERVILLLAGILGGILGGMVGSGIDIVTFSLMVLLFRINEKVATPTSVILMTFNALVGVSLFFFFLDGFNDTVREYWLSAIPVVVVGAPLGALICSRLSRETIVRVLLVLIAIEFVSSVVVIPLNLRLTVYGVSILTMFLLIYFWIAQRREYGLAID